MGEVAVMEPAGEPVALAVRERLEVFVGQVAGGLGRVEQRRGAELYVRGMLEAGSRKSLEPLVARLGDDGDYEALQHFLADSPWDPAVVLQATAELVGPTLGVQAWVLDDTGFPKDGKRSPGVKRQYSGRLARSATVSWASRFTPSGSAGRCRLAGRCICPRSGVMTLSAGGERRSPLALSFRPSPSWPSS